MIVLQWTQKYGNFADFSPSEKDVLKPTNDDFMTDELSNIYLDS